jgi:hypothetical protein
MIVNGMAVAMVLLSMVAVMNCEVLSSKEIESTHQHQASLEEAAKQDDSFDKWWSSVDAAGKAAVAEQQETEFVETSFHPAVVGRFTHFTKKQKPEDLLHNRELQRLPRNEQPKKVKKKHIKVGLPQKTALGFVLKMPHKPKVVKEAHLPVAMSSIIGKTEAKAKVKKLPKLYSQMSPAEKRARAKKLKKDKRKAWIKSHMSSVLDSLKAAKDAKMGNKKAPTTAPWHKKIKAEAMVQEPHAVSDLAEADDDAQEEEEELSQLGSLESMQRRKKKMLAEGTLLSKKVAEEDAKEGSTHALAIMQASLQAAQDYNLRHLHPGRLLAAKKAKEAHHKQRVAYKKAMKLQERKRLFHELSKTFTKRKKAKKAKKAPKKVKVKKVVKKAKPVKMLSTNLFSTEVVEDKHTDDVTTDPDLQDFLGDIGVGPKRAEKVAPPVPDKGTPTPAFVSDTMASLIAGDDDKHANEDSAVDESSKPLVGSLHVSQSDHAVTTTKVKPTKVKPTTVKPTKVKPAANLKTKAGPKPVLGSTAALIASLKKAGMAKQAHELEKAANSGVADLASDKKQKKVHAPQPKALSVKPHETDDVLVEQLKAAGMTKQAGVLEAQLKEIQH